MNVMPIGFAIFAALLPSIVFVGALLGSMIATEAGMKERGEARDHGAESCACDGGDERYQSSSTDSSDDSYDPDEAARRLAAHPWWGLR